MLTVSSDYNVMCYVKWSVTLKRQDVQDNLYGTIKMITVVLKNLNKNNDLKNNQDFY